MRDSTLDASYAAVHEDARPSSVSFAETPTGPQRHAGDRKRLDGSQQLPTTQYRQDMAASFAVSQDHFRQAPPHPVYTTERVVDMPSLSSRSSLLHRESTVHHTVVNGQPQQTANLPLSVLTGGPVVYQTARVASERVYKRDMHGFKVITVEDYNLFISLRVRNKELEEQIKLLESQSTASFSQQSIYSEMSNERARLFKEYKEELSLLEGKLKAFEAAKDEVEKQLSNHSSANASLKEKLDELEQTNRQLKSDNIKLVAENDSLTKDKNAAELTVRRQIIELASSAHSPSFHSSEILRKLKADENHKISDLEMKLLEREDLLSKALREKREMQDNSFPQISQYASAQQKQPTSREDHEELVSLHTKLSKLTRQVKEKSVFMAFRVWPI